MGMSISDSIGGRLGVTPVFRINFIVLSTILK